MKAKNILAIVAIVILTGYGANSYASYILITPISNSRAYPAWNIEHSPHVDCERVLRIQERNRMRMKYPDYAEKDTEPSWTLNLDLRGIDLRGIGSVEHNPHLEERRLSPWLEERWGGRFYGTDCLGRF